MAPARADVQEQVAKLRAREIKIEEIVADYLQSLKEIGLPAPVEAGALFKNGGSGKARCPRESRGCGSEEALVAWFELAVRGRGKTNKTCVAEEGMGTITYHHHVPQKCFQVSIGNK